LKGGVLDSIDKKEAHSYNQKPDSNRPLIPLMIHIPNLITFARILIIPVFIGLMIYGHTALAFAFFILAGVSDALDGFIARTWRLKTPLGTYLDPIADKLLLTSSFLTLSILGHIPVWATVVVVSRDLILVAGVLVLDFMVRGSHPGGYLPKPSFLGKITTASQILLLMMILFSLVFGRIEVFLPLALWVTIGLTVVSGIHYIIREIRLLNQPVEYRISPPGF
jgi:cardiolipin synthase